MKLSVVFSVVLSTLLGACGDDADPAPSLSVELLSAPREILAGPTVRVPVRILDRAGVTSAVLSAGSRGVVLDLAQLDERGETTVAIDLPEGPQTLHLVAISADGTSASDFSDVVVDSTAPRAELLAPAPAQIQQGPTFAVRVRVTDRVGVAGAVLTVGDAAYPIAAHLLDAAGEATLHVTAPAGGATALALRATDRAGHSAAAHTSLTVDVADPAVRVVAPRADAAETRRLLFAELSDELGIASVSYLLNDGAPRTLVPEGAPTRVTLREVLDLAPGANQLTLIVTDRAGRRRQQTMSFRYGHSVSAGGAHSGAVADGQLYTWGRYNAGQLGLGGALGDAQSRLAPELVPAFGAQDSTVAAIAFNQNTSVAIRSDRSVWTWGANSDGQLGHGDLVQRSVPTQLAGLSDIVYASTGYSHVLALRGDGAVLAWGKNAFGQAGVEGDGTANDDQPTPVVVAGLPDNLVEVLAGSEHSLALTADGRVFAWGRNQYGNLGNGSFDTARHPAPAEVPGLRDVIDLASGRDHVLALRADGTVATWGLGASGQLALGEPADGADEDRATPMTALAAADAPLTGVEAVYANGNTSYAIVAAAGGEQLWGWGQNFSGQLALGATSTAEWLARRAVIYTAADQPTYLDEVIALKSFGVGATHVIAQARNGVTYAWGWSFRGSLGVPTLAHAWAQTIALEVALPSLPPLAPRVSPIATAAAAPAGGTTAVR
jgi:alpha-tubulin suppressor-like RCC1 family protein